MSVIGQKATVRVAFRLKTFKYTNFIIKLFLFISRTQRVESCTGLAARRHYSWLEGSYIGGTTTGFQTKG